MNGDDGLSLFSTTLYAQIGPDGSMGPWTSSSKSLPVAINNATTVTSNGYVYVIGGSEQSGAPFLSTVYYIPASDLTSTVTNTPPTANVGVDQTVPTGSTVMLDGSYSTDPEDGNNLAYSWLLTSSPQGSIATISSPDSVNPTITTDISGNYIISLTVTDTNGLSSQPSVVTIHAVSVDILSIGPSNLYLGLKNSDDQGASFDLRTELYLNGNLISSGQNLCVTGITRNQSLAKLVTIPFGELSQTNFNSGDTLSLKVLTRIGTNADGTKCAGHNNATGLRMYYDGAANPSGLGLGITPNPMTNYYLDLTSGNYLLNNQTPTGISKYKDSASVNYNNGNLWKEVGTWVMGHTVIAN